MTNSKNPPCKARRWAVLSLLLAYAGVWAQGTSILPPMPAPAPVPAPAPQETAAQKKARLALAAEAAASQREVELLKAQLARARQEKAEAQAQTAARDRQLEQARAKAKADEEESRRRPAAIVAPPAPAPAPALALQPAVPSVRVQAGQVIQDCPECPKLVAIPAGSFVMGSAANEEGRYGDEGPQHRVTVSAFLMGQAEVTQGQWQALMGSNPSYFKDCGADCPVESLSWIDAQEYVKRLSQKTGKGYMLPSEAQWEYACRGGQQQRYCGSDNVDAVAWYEGNSNNKTHPLGKKQANGFGLYDMSGNVWEWTQDCWHDNYYGAPTDGSAWQSGDCAQRVSRGGSWISAPAWVRAANRAGDGSAFRSGSVGFRIARTAD